MISQSILVSLIVIARYINEFFFQKNALNRNSSFCNKINSINVIIEKKINPRKYNW